MLSFSGSLRIFIALDPCDMRAGINTLYALVGERLREDVKNVPSLSSPTNAAACLKCSTGMAPAAGS